MQLLNESPLMRTSFLPMYFRVCSPDGSGENQRHRAFVCHAFDFRNSGTNAPTYTSASGVYFRNADTSAVQRERRFHRPFTVVLLQITHASKRTEQPIRLNDLASIQLTEKQAMGYLLLVRKRIRFSRGANSGFELETHLLMRTTSQQARSKLYHLYK